VQAFLVLAEQASAIYRQTCISLEYQLIDFIKKNPFFFAKKDRLIHNGVPLWGGLDGGLK
jgi:hypothetical protein